MPKVQIEATNAPAAIGPYSQAVQSGRTIYLSGQIGLDPNTMDLVSTSFENEAKRVFVNLAAVAEAAGCSLDDAIKLTVYLTDLANFDAVNKIMAETLAKPYPARAAIGVAALPRGARIEIDAILVRSD